MLKVQLVDESGRVVMFQGRSPVEKDFVELMVRNIKSELGWRKWLGVESGVKSGIEKGVRELKEESLKIGESGE